ncbi:universal stress protein [Arthrobacter sp. STN4]|uniref:universal stress protein n=1 Tax=Arthrobacter sp. STN4 TaxID=2923276 RepID=UPI00211A14D9|nr:universal stress protein [Arthrobacter sp. STN4]MCQ9163950.1 universal stress protein [Arthrobacter sp. STN4]
MPDHHKRPQTHPAPLPHQKMTGPVVAGVVPGQPAIVIRQAAALAYSLGVGLVFAYVDVTRYLVEEHGGADDTSAPIDPDGVDEPDDVEGAARAIRERISAELGAGDRGDAGAGDTEPDWSLVTLAGEPARSLARFAESVHACVIVVGTRERGVGARLEEFLIGSVAVHLTHRQHRPVLVIPLDPHAPQGGS